MGLYQSLLIVNNIVFHKKYITFWKCAKIDGGYKINNNCPVPTVLVHGWKSHPGIWRRLTEQLEDRSIEYWNFDFSDMPKASPKEIAAVLMDYIFTMRKKTGYNGEIDIVCHSTGAYITRYLLEVIDGNTRNIKVRQWIGIGPANNGSSMAELFNDPNHGPQILTQLSGVFVPRRYDPSADIIVQELRPNSGMTAKLSSAGIRKDIIYRSIITANKIKTPDFFPYLEGKTWNCSPGKGWETTYDGDGVISHCDSHLPGTGFDILPADPSHLNSNPEDYCHIKLPRNEEVINRVIQYLSDPGTRPSSYW